MTLCMHSPLLLPQKDSMTSIPVWGMGKIKKPFLLFIITDNARATGEDVKMVQVF